MFSVVIPLYNKELSIRNTILSVLQQSYQNFEIVVVNDGSADGSVDAVKTIKDERVRLIHQENQGVSAARNRGIKEAKYKWIAFLDGDDVWGSNHLEEIVKMMGIFPNEKVYVTSFEYSDKRKMYRHERNDSIFKIENYFKEAINEQLICTNIIVVHAQCFVEVGAFNINLNRGEDLDLWTRLARRYDIVKSSNITAIYRVEAENRSSLTFDINKSRIFHYDFSDSSSRDEYVYHEKQILRVLRSFLKKKDFQNFLLLLRKHIRYISLINLLKSK